MKFIKNACILFIMASIIWGCNQDSSENKQDSKKEVQQQTQAPMRLETPSGLPDQHGRKPGDQHYGHGHAPGEHQSGNQLNTQQATPASGPDSRGRNPGDQHYGHDHD